MTLTKQQTDALEDVYYKQSNYFGVNKLYYILRDKYPNIKFLTQEIQSWLSQQEVYQLNKRVYSLQLDKIPKEINIPRNLKINIDLIDLTGSPFNKFNYILSVIEVYTKYTWLFPLRFKTPQNVALFLNPLLDKYKQINIIQSDNGNEFRLDKVLETSQKIIFVLGKPYSARDNSIIERRNRDVQSLLRQYRTATNRNNWPEMLETFSENINTSYSKSIRMTPKEAFENLQKQQTRVRKNKDDELLPIGTKVRLLNLKKIKGGNISNEKFRWSESIYEIYKATKGKVQGNKYFVSLNGNKMTGSYNINYLQVIPGIEKPPAQAKNNDPPQVYGKFKNAEVNALKNVEAPKNLKRRP